MNSDVQTGVKSAGCEKRTNHFPRKSLSDIVPCVVLAVKGGAGLFNCGKGMYSTVSFVFNVISIVITSVVSLAALDVLAILGSMLERLSVLVKINRRMALETFIQGDRQ